jgi:uncharacterized protein
MIKLHVAEIKKSLVGEKRFAYEVTPEELNLKSEDLPVTGKIKLEGKISNAGDVLLLQGTVSARVKRVCRRCLKEFEAFSMAEVLEKFYPSDADNIESDAYVYENDLVDVTEPVRESLILAEPLSVLCKEDCQGLCPVCGVDRNVTQCGCETRPIDPRLSALKQLLKD